jgi:glycosyltransferase involved in cell wall biosynthesis
MATGPKLAFINCRTYRGGAGLINMPFAFNIILKLQSEWLIDLYLGSYPNPEYGGLLSSSVTVHQMGRLLKVPYRFKELALFLRCFRRGYRAVFGMGQVGTWVAYLVAKVNRCPLIIINDEFPSGLRFSRWTNLSARAHRAADAIIVPDKGRIPTLCREVSGIASKQFVELLNIPLPREKPPPEINWHDRLALPADSIPLIFAGGVGDHNQVPELLRSVRSWAPEYVLIVRGHNRAFALRYRKRLRDLDIPGQIFWLLDPMTNNEFSSLLRYCRISFALYRPLNANMIEMGKASGKILQSVSLGVPVIASNFPSLDYVREYGLGRLVTHSSEIAGAVSDIMEDEQAIKERCRCFAERFLNYEEGWRRFEETFDCLLVGKRE